MISGVPVQLQLLRALQSSTLTFLFKCLTSPCRATY